MVKKYLLLVLCAFMMASCDFRHIMTEDEYNALTKAVLTFDLDWSELDEKPTGVTFVCFPCEENAKDTTTYFIHSNKTDQVTLTLPDQDYSIICFNQSETEFAALKFDFDSFEDSFVQMKSDEEMGSVNTKFDWTRGFNARTALKPRSFASGSLSSVKSGTRGFNARTALKPRSSIKSLSLSVSVFGINRSVLLKSKLTNLSSGKKLGTNTLLKETVDQEIASDNWNLDLADDDKEASVLTTSFGTFGIDPSLYRKTRAVADAGDKVILQLDFHMPDGTVYHVEIDVTEQLLAQLDDLNISDKGELHIKIGDKNDPEGNNNSNEDFLTTLGSINLHKTVEGMNVGVTSWGEPTVIEIKL